MSPVRLGTRVKSGSDQRLVLAQASQRAGANLRISRATKVKLMPRGLSSMLERPLYKGLIRVGLPAPAPSM